MKAVQLAAGKAAVMVGSMELMKAGKKAEPKEDKKAVYLAVLTVA